MASDFVNITFKPSYREFNSALGQAGLHLAMPPEWSRFWTKAKKGVVKLRLANSIIFTTATFYDAIIVFERTSKKVTAKIDVSKRVHKDAPITKAIYGEVIAVS